MFGLGGLFKMLGLQKLLKLIPVVSQVIQLTQAAFQFVSALAKGDIAGAFKSLIGPALSLAIASIPAAGMALGKVGDFLADKMDGMIDGIVSQMGSEGMSAAMQAEVKSSLQSFSTYLRSDAFTKQLESITGKDASAVVSGADLQSMLTGNMDSIFMGFVATNKLTTESLQKLMPNIMGMSESQAMNITNLAVKNSLSSYVASSAINNPVSLVSSSITATLPYQDLPTFPASAIPSVKVP